MLFEFGDGSFYPSDVKEDAAFGFILSEDLNGMHPCFFHFDSIFDSGHIGNHDHFN